MSEPTQNEILALLTRHELAIANLYAAYAKAFPAMAPFWQDLVLEEKAHADVLRALASQLQSHRAFLNPARFNGTAVQSSLDYVIRLTADATSGAILPVKALAAALDIERAMLENNFFAVFSSDHLALQREFVALANHTRQHVGRITDRLVKERNKT